VPRFVVQEHHARRLHWDFRLEMDGVLKSWAVPKGPPTEPGLKRLAVEVEDHDLDYIDFKGEIEEGYGKGTVAVWDSGSYELDERKEGLMLFRLAGGKLKGPYKLVFTGYGGGKGWLLIKGREKTEDGAETASGRRGPRKEKKAVRRRAKKAKKRRGGGALLRSLELRRAPPFVALA
jgi:DNA ligase D-like protein (predicted 3'-phosphoesterase)